MLAVTAASPKGEGSSSSYVHNIFIAIVSYAVIVVLLVCSLKSPTEMDPQYQRNRVVCLPSPQENHKIFKTCYR